MENLLIIIQVIVAIGLLNVWLFRFNKSTDYRGGGAKNMIEEFAEYGLPKWSVWVIGTAKILIAGMLLVGVIKPEYVMPSASLLVLLMLSAIGFHIKVHDSFKKTFPAIVMAILALFLVIYS